MQIAIRLKQILDVVESCPFVESKNISLSERPPNAGYISGSIFFSDGSALHIKEFLISASAVLTIVKYGYHYVSQDEALIFRYDNALDPKIKKVVGYPEHKHTSTGIEISSRPSLDFVMSEISDVIRKMTGAK